MNVAGETDGPSCRAPREPNCEAPEGLTAKSARGIAWTAGGLLLAEPIRMAFTAVLARLLAPEDFGLISLLSVFIGISVIVNDFGFSSALIQRRRLTREVLDTAFWLSCLIGVMVMFGVALVAGVAASVYGQEQIRPLMLAMSLALISASLVAVQNALIRREMRFQWPAVANVLGVVVSGVAAVLAAWHGLGVWSLVVMNLVNVITSGIVIQLASHFRPAARFSIGEAGILLRYGAKVAGADLAAYGGSTVDNLLVGSIAGVGMLGLYGVAFNVVVYPVRRVASMVAMVSLPAFAQVQDDEERVVRGYMRAVRLTLTVVMPLLAIAGVLADQLVMVLYGPQWAPAVLPLQVLCIAGAVRSIVAIDESVLRALGRPAWQMWWAVVMMAGIAVGALWGASRGLVATAAGVSVGTALTGMIGHRLIASSVGLSWRREVLQVAPPLAVALTAGIAACAIRVCCVALGVSELLTLLAAGIVGLILPWGLLRQYAPFRDIRDLEGMVMGLAATHTRRRVL